MKRTILFIVLLLTGMTFAFGAVKTSIAYAPEPEAQPPMTVQEMIRHWADYYDTSYEDLMAVAKCESGFRKDVYGDGGRAYGVYQYHLPTFKAFSKEFGEELDYKSANDQIRLTAFVFSKGVKYKRHWTCSRITGIIK